MTAEKKHIRHGFGSVRPYLYGNLDLPDFVKRVFGANEIERIEDPNGAHVEAQIGDSVIVMETGNFPPDATPTRASIYVYVDDVDAAYKWALESGGVSISEPEDKPYDERAAGVKDSFGNTWWISTFKKQL